MHQIDRATEVFDLLPVGKEPVDPHQGHFVPVPTFTRSDFELSVGAKEEEVRAALQLLWRDAPHLQVVIEPLAALAAALEETPDETALSPHFYVMF